MVTHLRSLAHSLPLLVVLGCGPALVEQGMSPGPAVAPIQPAAVSQQPPTDLRNLPQVPAASAVSLPARELHSRYHEVRSGETLTSIARTYGSTAAALADANGFDLSDPLQPGQLIYIPNAGSQRAAGLR